MKMQQKSKSWLVGALALVLPLFSASIAVAGPGDENNKSIKLSTGPSPEGSGWVSLGTTAEEPQRMQLQGTAGSLGEGAPTAADYCSTNQTQTFTGYNRKANVTLYAFALPKHGKSFAGWTLSSLQGAKDVTLGSTTMRATTVAGQAGDKDNTVTWKSPIANFTDVTPVDFDAHVGDQVTLHYYSATPSTWATVMDGYYVSGDTPFVAPYGVITRSVDTDVKTNHFAITLRCTDTLLGKVSKLSVINDAGVNYCYNLNMLPVRTCGASNEAIGIPLAAFSTNPWTATSDNPEFLVLDGLEPTTPAAGSTHTNILVHGVAAGEATVSASNYDPASTAEGCMGVECSYRVKVCEPLTVNLCEGDYQKSIYHSAIAKYWFLYVNGVRYDVDGTGELTMEVGGIRLQLAADDERTTDATLKINALTAGAAGDVVKVAVSDGDEYYALDVHVDAARVIHTGDPVDVQLASFNERTWQLAYISGADSFVNATHDATETPKKVATVTLTGVAPVDEAYVQMADVKYTGETGSQGLGYVLKMKIVGPKTIPVFISKGAAMTAFEGAEDVTAQSAYTVELQVKNAGGETLSTVNGDTGTATANGVTVTAQPCGAAGVTVTMAADETATPMSSFLAVVKTEGKTVVNYAITVYPSMTMAVGQIAPGCLYGAATPWKVWSSIDGGLKAQAVTYQSLYSARVEALKAGDSYFWASNTTTSAGMYAIKAQVHSVTNRSLCLGAGASTSFTVETREDGLEGVWGSSDDGSGRATLNLDNTSSAASSVQATLTAGATEGTCSFVVSNVYHVENISLYVCSAADSGKRLVWNIGQVTEVFRQGEGDKPYPQILPSLDFDGEWTAHVEDSSILTLTTSDGTGAGTSGGRDDRVWVQPLQAGTTRVIAKTATTVYIYDVKVTYQAETRERTTVGVGQTLEVPSASTPARIAVLAVAEDPMIVNPTIIDGVVWFTGLQEGETVVTVTTEDARVFKLPVLVHQQNVNKKIRLVIGKTTRSVYSYTFDRVNSVTEDTMGFVTVSRDGNTVTFTPNAPGNGYVEVEAQVDGLSQPTTLKYTIEVVELTDSQLEVINYDEGYIVYKGAAEVKRVGNDQVFVFTNTVENGLFEIPDGLTAKMDILAVGGGGGGGSAASFGKGGGGGGAGGFSYSTGKKFTKGTFSVVVGRGGESLVDDIGHHAAAGNNGGDSVITNVHGYALALANGGGGGGGPGTSNYSGFDGGSGGGGSYSSGRLPGQGGRGTDGQGANGGMPSTLNCGGGGGGAGGHGEDDGTGGEGKESDITGTTVTYARGGAGGISSSAVPAVSGAGFGDGGAGGNGGKGGFGADGIVIVRITELYKNIQVPIPSTNDLITARFQWEDGETFTPIEFTGHQFRSTSNNHPYYWSDVIDRITGVTNVVCTTDGTNKVGIGYYNFTIYLKDGYSWVSADNPEYGSVQGMRFRWVVTENYDDVDASISVHKTVWWSDLSNAMIRVSSISSPEMSGGGGAKVLYLGSMCSSHGLTNETISNSLAAVTSVGSCDCYFFCNDTLLYTNSFKQGDDTSWFRPELIGGGAHMSGAAFYRILNQKLIVEGNKDGYNYIIFEFDDHALGKSGDCKYYGGTANVLTSEEKEWQPLVVEALKEFYTNEGVLWVDIGGIFPHKAEIKDGVIKDKGYTAPGNDLMGLMDPWKFSTSGTATGVCDTNPLQVAYQNSAEVASFLKTKIKAKPYNLSYRDKIVNPAKGLTIQDISIVVCTNQVNGEASTDTNDWKTIMTWLRGADDTGTVTIHSSAMSSLGIKGGSMNVNLSTNLVTAVLSNIDFKVWARYDTHVLDDGTFCTSEDAEYNQSTGQWEKNPNEGAAYLSIVNDLGIGIGVEGDAETSVPWRYTAYEIVGTVVHGGIYVGGTSYSRLNFSEGRDVTVYYRGHGGYRLKSIKVDGVDVPLTEANSYSYTFPHLTSGHSIHVEYEPYYGDEGSENITHVYDGTAQVYPVIMDNQWDTNYLTEVRYSLEQSDDDADYLTAEEFSARYSKGAEGAAEAGLYNVGEHLFYYRIFAYQPGYGESFEDPGWVWVNTGSDGEGTVTVTPRPLVLTANSFKLDAQSVPQPPSTERGLDRWEGVSVVGLIEGDSVNTNGTLTWSCPTYRLEVGQYPVTPVLAAGKTLGDVADANYSVEFRPGVVSVYRVPMVIGDVTQFNGLDPEDPLVDTGVDRVEKVYDGQDTNLVINVNRPTADMGGHTIRYSTDDGKTWTSQMPVFRHAGTNKVWYAVESAATFEESLFFYVTNYNYVVILPRAITVEAASSERRYDGTPLTNPNFSQTAGELVEGDVLSATVTGSQTVVGTSDNVLGEVTVRHGGEDVDNTADYEITRLDGTLTVTPALIVINGVTHDPDYPPEYGQTGIDSAEKFYDGRPTNITVKVDVPTSNYKIQYSTDGGQTWQDENPSYVDAGSYTVHVKVSAPNYADAITFSRVYIKPRPVTVYVQPAQMKYGSERPAFSAIVTDDETGRALSEGVTYTIAVSCQHASDDQIPVGEHPISATGAAVQGNYAVSYVSSILTVGELDVIPYTVSNPPTPYDGQGHGIVVTPGSSVPGKVTVKYGPSSDGPWYDTYDAVTNVAQSGVSVYFTITTDAPGWQGVTNAAPVFVNPLAVTVTAEDKSKLAKEAEVTLTATVTGVLEGESASELIKYTLSREEGEEPGTYAINPSGDEQQGNYVVTFVPGTYTIRPWLYPVGPYGELIPIDETWISEKGGDDKVVNYETASNYVFSLGSNGVTNWYSYVMGLDPTNFSSCIYLDIEPNLAAVTNPTLVARGAHVHEVPIGALTNVVFRLSKSASPTGTYEKVGADSKDGRFPQTNVDVKYYRVRTILQFEHD